MTGPHEDIAFEYRLRGAGWADARLAIGGTEMEMRASYLTDALGDLVRAVLALTRGEPRAFVTWDEEGCLDVWSFARTDDRVDVIVQVDKDGRRDLYPPVAGTVLLSALVDAVVAAARGVLAHWGEARYVEDWEHEFPADVLRALEDWLSGRRGPT